MAIELSLHQTLNLVGKLDDSAVADCPRERFRKFLSDNIKDVKQIRVYIEECLNNTGDQYARALQDLVNHLGTFLGFTVQYGRYQGVQGENGFDGHWISPSSKFHLVTEVKTTEVYAIKTTALLGYVDSLISEHQIPNWETALGLYIVGRPDPQVKQLENAIIAERRTDQLRVISVESLLRLAEMTEAYGVKHDDVVAVLQPSGPNIDFIVNLMQRLVSTTNRQPTHVEVYLPPEDTNPVAVKENENSDASYWLTPVKSYKEETAKECIQKLVGKYHIYAFGDRTPGRKKLKIGDWICFYENGNGVIGHARVSSLPQNQPNDAVRLGDKYPWVFKLDSIKLYLDKSVTIEDLREKLDAFKDKNLTKGWAWFVQGTKAISKHDFDCLVRE